MRNHEWLLTTHTLDVKDILLARGTILVKGKCFKIRSADKRHFTARVHWAPVFITNNVVKETLGDYAEVNSIKHELYTDAGLNGIATGVRQVVLTGDRHQVQHILQVVDPDTAEVWNCLVTIAGRPPMCLRCKKVGHVRKNCDTPSCRHHGQYGHATEGCSADKASKAKTSYASVVLNVPQIDIDESDMIDRTDEGDETDGTGLTEVTELRNDSARHFKTLPGIKNYFHFRYTQCYLPVLSTVPVIE